MLVTNGCQVNAVCVFRHCVFFLFGVPVSATAVRDGTDLSVDDRAQPALTDQQKQETTAL